MLGWLMVTAAAMGQSATVVWQGEPRSVIVLATDADAMAQFAAEELQHHIARATGATLPILLERDAALERQNVRLYVGRTAAALNAGIDPAALPPSGFVLRTVGSHLYLVGRDEQIRMPGNRGEPVGLALDPNRSHVGTMLAVYEFLETQLGVRWLWPGEVGTFVPARQELQLPALDQTGAPRYRFKRWRVPRFMREEVGWSSRDARDAFLTAQNTWLRRHRYLQVEEADPTPGHTFVQYWRTHGERHPEMFAQLPDGRRAPLPGDATGRRISMCVSEPRLWQQVIEDWQGYRMATAPWVRAGENDTPALCVCERCRAWDEPDPGFDQSAYWAQGQIPPAGRRFRWDWSQSPALSDRYARFYRQLLIEAQKIDPAAQVAGYAYANYARAPRNTRLSPEILIAVVPSSSEGLTASSYFPYTPNKSAAFREQWDGWGRTGASLILRPNLTLVGHNFPLHYADRFGADVGHAAAHGMVASDFDSLRGAWGTQAPTLYVLARIQERPELGVAALLAEFYQAFGEAGPAVQAYFDYWQQISDRVTQEQMLQWIEQAGAMRAYSHWFLLAPFMFPEAVLAEGRRLLDAAVATAVSDPAVRQRLVFLDRGLQDVERVMDLTLAHQAYLQQPDDTTLARYAAAMRALVNHRQDSEGWHIGNFAALNRDERAVFDWSLLETAEKTDGRLPLTWQFRLDPQEIGVAQRWFTETPNDAAWDTLTYGAWQQQPPGLAWRERHGRDYHGLAWYRTPLEVPTFTAAETRVMLRFGAVDEAAIVWIDGRQVLDRPFDPSVNPNAWREPFEIDVTEWVRSGEVHRLVVRVESRGGQGGITRPVYLHREDR